VSGCVFFFFFSSRRRHTRLVSDWSSDVCSSDLLKRRRLDAIDGQDREDEGVLSERIAVGAEHQTAFALDPGAHFLGFGRKRVERSEERRVGKEGRSRGSPYH